MLSIFELDIKSLIGILVWGNATLAVLAFGYLKFHSAVDEKLPIKIFGFAKITQSFAFLFLFLRTIIPPAISIYLGNIFIFLGFLLESIVILIMIDSFTKNLRKIQIGIFVFFTVLMIALEISFGSDNLRMSVTSFGVLSLFIFPTYFYIFKKSIKSLRIYIGYFLLVVLSILFVRGIHALFSKDISLFSQTPLQSTTFIALILLLIVNCAGLLLIMCEKSGQKTKKYSDIDSLTDIPNRRYFMEKASSYFKRHQMSKSNVSILFIDIDEFKKINDVYGHVFGDQVLLELAQIIKGSVRPTDLICRYKDEEFLILLNETNKDHALIVANRIHRRFNALRTSKEPSKTSTISVGVYSKIPSETESLEDYIGKTHQILRQSAMTQHNKVFLYKEDYDELESDQNS
jgi:diguanylate cyclase (GGDEF)-like protein